MPDQSGLPMRPTGPPPSPRGRRQQEHPHAVGERGADDHSTIRYCSMSVLEAFRLQPSASAIAVGDQRRDVGQREQVAGHDQRIAPGVGLALARPPASTCIAAQTRTRPAATAPSPATSSRRASAPAARPPASPAADSAYTVPSAPTATSRAASPGHQRDADLPVEADRRGTAARARGPACRRSCTGSPARWRRRAAPGSWRGTTARSSARG